MTRAEEVQTGFSALQILDCLRLLPLLLSSKVGDSKQRKRVWKSQYFGKFSKRVGQAAAAGSRFGCCSRWWRLRIQKNRAKSVFSGPRDCLLLLQKCQKQELAEALLARRLCSLSALSTVCLAVRTRAGAREKREQKREEAFLAHFAMQHSVGD